MKQQDKINWRVAIVIIGVLFAQYTAPSFAKEGEVIYKAACRVCHDTGVMGAPKHGKKGIMPAKGGKNSLSDDVVKAAVAYMINAVEYHLQ